MEEALCCLNLQVCCPPHNPGNAWGKGDARSGPEEEAQTPCGLQEEGQRSRACPVPAQTQCPKLGLCPSAVGEGLVAMARRVKDNLGMLALAVLLG